MGNDEGDDRQIVHDDSHRLLQQSRSRRDAGGPIATVTSADPLDRTSLELERDFTLRLLDRENKLIVKIKKALEKIEDQTFGICEICCEEIDIERLKWRPVTELRIGCKTHQERLEKLTCE